MKKKFLKILALSSLMITGVGVVVNDFIYNGNDVQITEAASVVTYSFDVSTISSSGTHAFSSDTADKNKNITIGGSLKSVNYKFKGIIEPDIEKTFTNSVKFDSSGYIEFEVSGPWTAKVLFSAGSTGRKIGLDSANTTSAGAQCDVNASVTGSSKTRAVSEFSGTGAGKVRIHKLSGETHVLEIVVTEEETKTLTGLNIAFENETAELHNGGEAAIKVNGTYDDGSKEESITGATWTVEDSNGKDASNLAKVENNIVKVIANPDTDTNITLTASYEGVTSNALQVTIKHFNPAENITLSLNFGIVTPTDTSINNIEVPKNLAIGEDVLPALTSATGETFLGWYDGNTLVTSESTFASAATLTAKWNVMKADNNATTTTPAVKLGIENCTFTTESQAGFKRISSIDEIKSGAPFTLLSKDLGYVVDSDAGSYYDGAKVNSVVDDKYFLANSSAEYITLQLEDAGLVNNQQTYYIKVFDKVETSNDYLSVDNANSKRLINGSTKDNWTVEVSKDGQLTMIDITTSQKSNHILYRTTDHRFNAYEVSETTQLPVGFVYTTEAHRSVVSADFTNSAAMMQYAVHISKNYYDNLVDNTEFGEINVKLSQGEKSVPVVVKLTKNAELTAKLNTKYETGSLYYELSYTISGINNYDVDIAIDYTINDYKSQTRHYTVKELVNYYLTNNLLDGELKVIVNEYKTNIGA